MKKILMIWTALLPVITAYAAPFINPPEAKHILIYGQIKSNEPVDTVTLTFWNNFVYDAAKIPEPLKMHAKTRHGGLQAYGEYVFRFAIPAVNAPGYISISYGRHVPVALYLVEPGDSIMMQIDIGLSRIMFSGPAADKFRCQYLMDRAQAEDAFGRNTIMRVENYSDAFKTDSGRRSYEMGLKTTFGKKLVVEEIDREKDVLNIADGIANEKWRHSPSWRMLEQYKDRVPDGFYRILQSNMMGKHLAYQLGELRRIYDTSMRMHDTALAQLAKRVYYEKVKNLSVDHFDDHTIVHSNGYPQYLLEKCFLQEVFEEKETRYQLIKNNYSGVVRDKVTGIYFITGYQKIRDIGSLLGDALQYVESDMRGPLEQLYSRHSKGMPTKNFLFEDKHGKKVRLHDFKGKMVFIDFWFTGCSACADFYKHQLSKVEEHFRGNPDVVFITISADKDRERWLKSVQGGKYAAVEGVNLYAPSQDSNAAFSTHEVFSHFNVYSFPYQIMLDRKGNIYRSGDLRKVAAELIGVIEGAMKEK